MFCVLIQQGSESQAHSNIPPFYFSRVLWLLEFFKKCWQGNRETGTLSLLLGKKKKCVYYHGCHLRASCMVDSLPLSYNSDWEHKSLQPLWKKRSFGLSNDKEQDDYITQELHIYMSAYENWKELPS